MEYGTVLVWWVVYQVLLLAGLPIAYRLVPGFPDHGASLALPVALVVLTIPAYWLGQVAFGTATLVAAMAVLGATTYVAGREGVPFDRRTYVETVVVFTAAFAFLVAVRALDPSAHPGGGEKFLDMGLLQSLLRATYLPPEDMWFAGERVQYYYGGHLVSALLAKLTATPGRYAYNLALAGFYAMEVTAVYGVAAAIADHRDVPRRLAGLFGVFLFGFASNLLTPARLAASLLPVGTVTAIADRVNIAPRQVAISPGEFSYWTASRVIPDTINEFPLFAYLNGDLHAHMMSTAFLMLLVGVLYGYYRTPADERWRRRALVLGATPPVAGLMLMVSTWSFPTALGVTWLALTFAPASPVTLLPERAAAWFDRDAGRWEWLTDELVRTVLAFAFVGVVGGLAVAWVAPFLPNVLLRSVGDRHLAFLPTRSGMGPLLLVHGAFVLVFGVYLAGRARLQGRLSVAVAAAALLLAGGWVYDLAAVAAIGPLLVGGWYLLRTDRAGYETVLLVAGAGLVMLVEFAYLKDNAAPERMNTVFKTYLQVWTLWATAAGVALATIVTRRETPLPLSGDARRAFGATFAAVLVVSLSLYGGLALAKHTEAAGPATLDALRYTHDDWPGSPGEGEAIEWVNDLEGQPHIASAPTWEVYGWGNPASSMTGVPTVVGWAHERIYRGADAYGDRVTDVKALYTGDRRTREIIVDKYDVAYIWVGPIERERYDDPSFEGTPWAEPVFENEQVTIYAVNRSAIS